jgi:UDP-glucose 4-epimerase
MKRALVTGGAGFIGSNLADRLIADGVEVAIIDNFRTGRREFLEGPAAAADLIEGDVLDPSALARAVEGCDTVFHLQANADVRHGLDHPRLDIEQNLLATSALLEAMRAAGVNRIVFSSTGSIYGEPETFPTPEDCPFPVQTSLYGASKAAAEGLIAAYCHGYGFTGTALRFVSVLGERYSHGHVFDFVAALRRDPSRLRILGNGKQRKSYMHVADCVDGILLARDSTPDSTFEVFNLGADETVVVDDSVAIITATLGVSPELEYTGGERGWPGDSPLIHLDATKIRAQGWTPKLTIREGIERTIAWLQANEWVLDEDEVAA